MRLFRKRAQNAAACGILGVGLCLTGHSARADVKIVTEIETTGYLASNGRPSGSFFWDTDGGDQGASNGTHTVTAYYKDRMARTETDTGQVTLYDAAAKKIYRIDPEQKTYSVATLDVALKPQYAPGASLPEGARLDTGVDLDVTRTTREVVGKQARKYMLDGYIRTVIERPDNFGSNGHGGLNPGAGRFPGTPGGDSAPPGAGKAPIPSTQIGGEYWLADTSFLPAAAKGLILPLLRSTFPLAPLLKPLHARLTKLKLIPLYSQVIIRAPGSDPQSPGEVITAEVKSITEGPLDDGLFKVPDGYRKVDPATADGRRKGQH